MTEQALPLYVEDIEDLGWVTTTADFLQWQGDDITAEQLHAWHTDVETPPGSRYHPGGVVYGTAGAGGRDMRMLLYSRADPSERRPAFLVMHGGGFRGGTPASHRKQAAFLAARGWVAGSVQYRFAQEATFPAALEDVKCAIRFLRANHERFGVDPDRIAIGGGSAGGYLAAMAALTPGRWEGTGGHEGVSSEVQAAVLLSALTDAHAPGAMPEVRQLVAEFLGGDDEELLTEASPVTHVHAGAPPTLMVVGGADPATPQAMVEAFRDALDAAGVANELVVIPGRPHAIGMLGEEFMHITGEIITGFLERTLGPVAR